MKLKGITWILALALACTVACEREETLTPSAPENIYGDPTLPQGDHPYDATILDWFAKYNTLFLYKYVPHDLYFNATRWLGGTYDPVRDTTFAGFNAQNHTGYFDVPADERYVGEQLSLIREVLLDFYPEAYLKQCLPKKIFLLDSIYWSTSKKGKPLVNLCQTFTGGDFIAISWGAARVQTITTAEKALLRDSLNGAFISVAINRGGATRPAAFEAISNYSDPNIFTRYNELGILDPWVRDAAADWRFFLKTIVSTSRQTLNAAAGTKNFLHPSFDVNGLVRRKYDVVIDYFMQEHGIDLQAIGDAEF
ncbi:MAG: hypothetical protein LBI96_00810 [Odoribacteraceae bacterium]|jgi:hypothetical protein|nr:hypothetical protein [Odoribacteraceae bacterium]